MLILKYFRILDRILYAQAVHFSKTYLPVLGQKNEKINYIAPADVRILISLPVSNNCIYNFKHVGGKGEVHTGFRWGNLRERDHLEDLVLYGRILKWTLKKWVGRTWTGLVWFRIGTSGGLL
jgi:hypothetical protein